MGLYICVLLAITLCRYGCVVEDWLLRHALESDTYLEKPPLTASPGGHLTLSTEIMDDLQKVWIEKLFKKSLRPIMSY